MNQMMQAMQALQQMQAKVAETEAKLATMAITEVFGEGAVRVTVDGTLRVTALEIDNEMLSGLASDGSEDPVIATINRALASAEQMKANELAAATQGMMPGMPGLFGQS